MWVRITTITHQCDYVDFSDHGDSGAAVDDDDDDDGDNDGHNDDEGYMALIQYHNLVLEWFSLCMLPEAQPEKYLDGFGFQGSFQLIVGVFLCTRFLLQGRIHFCS